MAAWLSLTARKIYLPIAGLFNCLERPDIDLLPISDRRYRFFLFGKRQQPWQALPEQIDEAVTSREIIRELSEGDAQYRKLRREQKNQSNRDYRARIPEASRASTKKWQAANVEHRRAYVEKNRAKIAAKDKLRRQKKRRVIVTLQDLVLRARRLCRRRAFRLE